MSDYSDLKLIAEACEKHQPLRFMRNHGALYIRNENGIVFDVHQNRSFPDFMAQNKDYADLVLAASPTAVLALIAENEELKEKYEASRDRKNSITLLKMQNDLLKSDLLEMTKFKEHMVELREAHGFDSWAAALVEVDKLRAEVERVKSLNHQQFGDAIRRNAEIDRLKIRLEIVRNLLGSSVPSDAELDIAIDAALRIGAQS